MAVAFSSFEVVEGTLLAVVVAPSCADCTAAALGSVMSGGTAD